MHSAKKNSSVFLGPRSLYWRPRFSTPEMLLYFLLQRPLPHLNGHPSKCSPWAKLLNFSDLTGTGVSNLVLPYRSGLYRRFFVAPNLGKFWIKNVESSKWGVWGFLWCALLVARSFQCLYYAKSGASAQHCFSVLILYAFIIWNMFNGCESFILSKIMLQLFTIFRCPRSQRLRRLGVRVVNYCANMVSA